MAHALHGVARLLAGNPGDAAGALRDLAVERQRGFQRNQRKFRVNPAREIFVQVLRLFLQHAAADANSGAAQFRQSLAGNGGIGVVHRGDYAFDSRGNDRFRARAGAACVAARFERDVESGAARIFPRVLECDDFRVIATVVVVKSFAHNSAVLH